MTCNNVMIVEDQPLQRELFKMYIQNSAQYQMVCTTDNAALVDVYLVKNKIDVILMDICTALGESGLDAAERIKRRYPDIKIVIITSMADYSYVERAKQIGVDSFWYKEAGESELIEVLNLTMAGGQVYPNQSPDIKLGNVSIAELTKQEIDIIRCIVKGMNNDEISKELQYSYNTIKKYINVLMVKTGFNNRTELAVKAVEINLISS